MAAVVKDVGEIWTRLFDHRPFVQGELTFFVREFQDKRNDREVERLFKIIEYSTDIGQSQLDRAVELGDSQLPSLKANVDVALSMCERVLQREGKFNTENQLKDRRDLRKTEWQKFISEMSEKCLKVDQEFLERENELKEYYVDLERKLHIAP
ncbi:biogenesis of lysosome-related organelles complex 1 subunit 5 [Belonocnema kinseyi]|uniref:biogenesis of lysosome-related organelles complex 1 subunit 5 n=1 Tax=Belonocnema kinseyi TaxID=2817044 RepID=UPI00143D5636|nr:biogenesis of lysosome-related organelles complex 1 subunit 5 [Belonocnema kinseyi]